MALERQAPRSLTLIPHQYVSVSLGYFRRSYRATGTYLGLLIISMLCVFNFQLEKAAEGVAQCEVSAYARSCRRCVAAYWKEQTRRSQNCKYLP